MIGTTGFATILGRVACSAVLGFGVLVAPAWAHGGDPSKIHSCVNNNNR